MKRILAATLTCLTFVGGAAATPLPEPTTIDPGEIDTHATLDGMRFTAGQGNTFQLTPGFRFGLPGSFDAGFALPYRYDGERREGALRHVRGELGYGLRGPMGLEGAFRGYATLLPADEEEGIGTGSHNMGVRTDWATDRWLDYGTVRMGAALERIDHRRPGEVDRPYRLATRMVWDGGLEFDIDSAITPIIGLRVTHGVGRSIRRDQESAALRPGVRIPLNPDLELQLTGHVDLIQRDAEPKVAVSATLIYRRRPPPRPDYDALTQQVGHTQLQVDSLVHRVRDIERLIAEDPDEYEREPEGIHVLNHSGIPDLEARVAELLEEAGFSIAHTDDEPEVHRRHRTLVEYRSGEADTANRIARSLPGFQVAEPNDNLPREVRVRILVGFDLE